jgi:uncharacterized RDD family membrane protein YckC
MICRNCNIQTNTSKAICPNCQTLFSNYSIGTLGSPARRFAGYLIDYGIGAFLATSFILGMFDPTGETSVAIFMVMVVFYLGQGIMWTRSTSIGKKVMGLRVYDKSGYRVGFLKMIVRETIGKIISGLIFSLGYIWILIDDENQAWHDKFINSVVIKEY